MPTPVERLFTTAMVQSLMAQRFTCLTVGFAGLFWMANARTGLGTKITGSSALPTMTAQPPNAGASNWVRVD